MHSNNSRIFTDCFRHFQILDHCVNSESAAFAFVGEDIPITAIAHDDVHDVFDMQFILQGKGEQFDRFVSNNVSFRFKRNQAGHFAIRVSGVDVRLHRPSIVQLEEHGPVIGWTVILLKFEVIAHHITSEMDLLHNFVEVRLLLPSRRQVV